MVYLKSNLNVYIFRTGYLSEQLYIVLFLRVLSQARNKLPFSDNLGYPLMCIVFLPFVACLLDFFFIVFWQYIVQNTVELQNCNKGKQTQKYHLNARTKQLTFPQHINGLFSSEAMRKNECDHLFLYFVELNSFTVQVLILWHKQKPILKEL